MKGERNGMKEKVPIFYGIEWGYIIVGQKYLFSNVLYYSLIHTNKNILYIFALTFNKF